MTNDNQMSKTIVFYDKSSSDTLKAKEVFEYVHKDKDIAYIAINADSKCDNGVHYTEINYNPDTYSFICINKTDTTTYDLVVDYIRKGELND